MRTLFVHSLFAGCLLVACQVTPEPGSAQERIGQGMVTGGNTIRDVGTATGDPMVWALGSGIVALGTLIAGRHVHKKMKAAKQKKIATP